MTIPILHFTIPGTPRPKYRARSGVVKRKGCDGTRREDYRSLTFDDPRNDVESNRIWPVCRRAMHEQRIERASGAVALYFIASFLLPKSLSAKERMGRIWHVQVPDKDNCEKQLADALKGIAWDDDCKVVDGAQAKTWSATWEGYEVWIAQLPNDPLSARGAFRDLRVLNAQFLDRFEELTFAGRLVGDRTSLGLVGL